MRVLILGGTTEATRLAALLVSQPWVSATMSLAGRTANPAAQPIPTRIGGFGGVDGLAEYLVCEKIDALVDATHPFAEQISSNAVIAAKRAKVPLITLTREPWRPLPGDRWSEVSSLAEAVVALELQPRRVLLTVGRLGLAAFDAAPQHHYVIRSIDPLGAFKLPNAKVILDRPPFDERSERALMQAEKIDVIVTKNSGGTATYGKISAARSLSLPVVIVRQPPRPEGLTVHDPERVVAHLQAMSVKANSNLF
jgi:precorrin-6A/cobalt-precorrin-6A reductase